MVLRASLALCSGIVPDSPWGTTWIPRLAPFLLSYRSSPGPVSVRFDVSLMVSSDWTEESSDEEEGLSPDSWPGKDEEDEDEDSGDLQINVDADAFVLPPAGENEQDILPALREDRDGCVCSKMDLRAWSVAKQPLP